MNNTQISDPELGDDENPEWTDAMFEKSKLASDIPELKQVLKANRGRPRAENPKKTISIRLSGDVLDYFKSTGKGWQTRMNEVLAEYVKSHRNVTHQ